jgi:hypothetical protein
MCLNDECPSRWKCYRYAAPPGVLQSYSHFEPPPRRKTCDMFWEVSPKNREIAMQARIDQLTDALRPFAALLQEHNKDGPVAQPIFAINDAVITRHDLIKAVLLTEEKRHG